jgi:23S rRNA (guanosine2251-2'-O)-methyltransferase
MHQSPHYLKKKRFFEQMLTLYGRNSVMEALDEASIEVYRLHLSTSNKSASIIDQILNKAKQRGVEIRYHDKKSLSRISKNSKQDQGVALDVRLAKGSDEASMIKRASYRILALDGVQNPQNLGMIIRSATAGSIDAILLPQKGASSITPLVIKASAGTLFRIPMIQTNDLLGSLEAFQAKGATLYTLSSHATKSYKEVVYPKQSIFVLGNESSGVSEEIERICDEAISIPMQRGVESLNVAVTASLLAFL